MRKPFIYILITVIVLFGISSLWSGTGDIVYEPGDSIVPGSDTYVLYNNGGAFGGDSKFIFNDTTGDVTLSTGSFVSSASDEGYHWKSDDDGANHFTYKDNILSYHGSTNVDGMALAVGAAYLAYFVNLNPHLNNAVYATADDQVPAMVFHNVPTGYTRDYAPMQFYHTSTDGIYKGIGMDITATGNTAGEVFVTGIEVEIESDADTGNDTSGIYVNQQGGGNASSFFKTGNTGTGNALEIGTTHSSATHNTMLAQNAGTGIVIYAVMGNESGGSAFRASATSAGGTTRRAFQLVNSASAEKFYVDLAGNIYWAGLIQNDIGAVGGNWSIEASTGNIATDGTFTAAGGSDPPYETFWAETRKSVVEKIKIGVPPQYLNGCSIFYNSETGMMEIFLMDKGEFRDFDGKLLEKIDPVQPWEEYGEEYRINPNTGDVVKRQIKRKPNKYVLKSDYELDKKTGKLYRLLDDGEFIPSDKDEAVTTEAK